MALQALERQAPVDEAQRCTLLLALGEAQRKAGESLRPWTLSSALLTSPGRWEHRSTWRALHWSSSRRPGELAPGRASSAPAGGSAAGAR